MGLGPAGDDAAEVGRKSFQVLTATGEARAAEVKVIVNVGFGGRCVHASPFMEQVIHSPILSVVPRYSLWLIEFGSCHHSSDV